MVLSLSILSFEIRGFFDRSSEASPKTFNSLFWDSKLWLALFNGSPLFDFQFSLLRFGSRFFGLRSPIRFRLSILSFEIPMFWETCGLMRLQAPFQFSLLRFQIRVRNERHLFRRTFQFSLLRFEHQNQPHSKAKQSKLSILSFEIQKRQYFHRRRCGYR